MSKPDKPAEAADAAPAKKSNKKLFIIIGAAVILLGGGGAGAWFFTHSGHDSKEKTEEAEPAKAPVFLPLEAFTVNLQGGDQYLQTEITLQLEDEAHAEEIKLNMPRVRSRLLTLLSSKTAEELGGEADKKKLAQEIMARIKEPFDPKGKPQKIVDVLFTTFVIQ